MKKHWQTILFAVVFLVGLAIFLYPTVSNFINERQNESLIEDYIKATEKEDEETANQWLEEASTYNQYLYDSAKLSELGLKYEKILNPYDNGVMGYVEIPKINISLVIYHSTDDAVLQNGVGHMENTSLPVGGENTHCALAAHRGLPSAKLFSDVDYLEIGDVFYIHVLGEVLEYRVDDVSVVEPEAVSNLRVKNGEDYVTLVTCTPYGVNSHRLLVRGTRVKDGTTYVPHNLHVKNELFRINPVYLLPITLVLLILVAGIIRRVRMKKQDKKNQSGTLLFLLLVTIALSPGICAQAAAETGSITVNTYNETANEVISGCEVGMIQVAVMDDFGNYHLTEEFADSGLSLTTIEQARMQSAQEVYEYILEHQLELNKIKSNHIGQVTFSDLEKGIYLICSESRQQYSFQPYFVYIPQRTSGDPLYNLQTAPKTKNNFIKQIKINIIWDDYENKHQKRPKEIGIILYQNEEEYGRVSLNAKEGWQHIFDNLPDGIYTYEILSQPIDEYVIKQTGSAQDGFFLTYRYREESSEEKLPQTGNDMMTLYLMMILGAGCVIIGTVMYAFGQEKHDENA